MSGAGLLTKIARLLKAQYLVHNQGQTPFAPIGPQDWASGEELVIDADDQLANVKAAAAAQRYGRYIIRFQDWNIYCHDLLSFYMAAKDIFLRHIYDFTSSVSAPRIIDGGGHIGLFALAAKRKYPNARISIFEPDPFALMLLRKNLAANNITDAEVIDAGLFKKEALLPFAGDNSDGGSFFLHNTAPTQARTVSLSLLLQDEVDFVKLNIEGAEFDVVKEISPRLRKIREMVIEYHAFPELGQRLHELLGLLHGAGFRYLIHDFDVETNGATKPPFHLSAGDRYFLLIYAKRMEPSALAPRKAAAQPLSVQPVCREFGFSRGSPVDRYYMQHFLERHKKAVKGRVLEAGDPAYTHQFGSRVVKSDVLNVIGSPGTTVVGNLQSGTGIPLAHYDCVILTQTVQFVFGIEKAVRNAYRALKPGGTLLLTASGISQISRYDMDRWGEYWRLTDLCLKEILSRAAPDAQTEISTYGNVASAKAFLDGISAEELPREVLDYQDPDYQLLIAAVVHKPKTVKKKALPHVQPVLNEPVILLYHRVANDPVDSQLLAVTPEHFSQQLSCLSEHLRVLALEELLDEVRRGFYCPDTAALTFDDGYADNLLNARALLEHHRLPATFFVASGMTGSTREFWWDAFEHLLLLPDVIKERAEINLNGRTLEFKLDNAAARFAAYDQLCGLCRALPPSEAASAARQLYAAAGLPEDGRLSHRALSREQLKQLAASPVSEIGSHTIDHAFLAALPAVEQRRQLVDSKAELERITGQTVRFLSYPWGTPDTFSAETMRIAQETGYEAGIANIQDALRAPVDFFAVPRFLVRNWNGEQFLQWLRTPAPDRGRFEQQMLNSRERRLSHGLY